MLNRPESNTIKNTVQSTLANLEQAVTMEVADAYMRTPPIAEAKKPEGKPKFINIRYKDSEYRFVSEVAGLVAMSKADFCRKASIWLGQQIKAGRVSILGGIITEKDENEMTKSRGL
jgi:hypothetical protein